MQFQKTNRSEFPTALWFLALQKDSISQNRLFNKYILREQLIASSKKKKKVKLSQQKHNHSTLGLSHLLQKSGPGPLLGNIQPGLLVRGAPARPLAAQPRFWGTEKKPFSEKPGASTGFLRTRPGITPTYDKQVTVGGASVPQLAGGRTSRLDSPYSWPRSPAARGRPPLPYI